MAKRRRRAKSNPVPADYLVAGAGVTGIASSLYGLYHGNNIINLTPDDPKSIQERKEGDVAARVGGALLVVAGAALASETDKSTARRAGGGIVALIGLSQLVAPFWWWRLGKSG